MSEHYRDCNGNNSAHVQGRRKLDLIKGYFLSVHMVNLSATGLKLLALLQFAPKTFETNELEHEVPCHREATQANRS